MLTTEVIAWKPAAPRTPETWLKTTERFNRFIVSTCFRHVSTIIVGVSLTTCDNTSHHTSHHTSWVLTCLNMFYFRICIIFDDPSHGSESWAETCRIILLSDSASKIIPPLRRALRVSLARHFLNDLLSLRNISSLSCGLHHGSVSQCKCGFLWSIAFLFGLHGFILGAPKKCRRTIGSIQKAWKDYLNQQLRRWLSLAAGVDACLFG